MDKQLQTKIDEIRILFLKISKACACRDLADDSKLQVSSLHYKAALLLDEVRVNLELTNVEYENRFLVEVDETLCLGRWKKQKEMCTPHNQTFINGFFAVSGSTEGHMALNIISINSNVSKLSFPPSHFLQPCRT